MSIEKKIPWLFVTPSNFKAKQNFLANFLFLSLAIAAYSLDELILGFPYFPVLSLLLIGHGYYAIKASNLNLIFLFRYSLIWILIGGTAIVWAIYGGDVKTAPFGENYQNKATTKILVFAGYLSLCGSVIGWLFAFRNKTLKKTQHVSFGKNKKIMMIGIGGFLSASFSILYFFKSGGIISQDAVYGSKGLDVGFSFGVFNVFHMIGISLLIISTLDTTKNKQNYYLFCIATLVVGMLAGSRADYLPQAFLLAFIMLAIRFNIKIRKITTIKILMFSVISLIFLYAAYQFAIFIALWREAGDVTLSIQRLISSNRSSIIFDIYGHKMLYLETGNMMIGGLYSAIVNVRDNLTGLLYGESYFNWILISPPGFLGLPRPLGLEWSTNINGQRMSQGGIFEVAEAYWNFGLAGCFLISFFISYFLGFLLRKGLSDNSVFFTTWYLVSGLMALRAVWYQNFAYFRIMTIMLVLYVFARFLLDVCKTKKNNNSFKPTIEVRKPDA